MSIFLPRTRIDVPTKDICSWIFDRPEFDVNRPCNIDAIIPERSINHSQARSLVRKLIAGFHASGLQPGDIVCLHSFNSIYYTVLVLAIIGAGGVCLLTNPTYTTIELTHQLTSGDAKFVITETGGHADTVLKVVQTSAKAASISGENIFIFDHEDCQGDLKVPPEYKSWRRLLDSGEKDWIRFDDPKSSRETMACLLFSSGTTGLPKAIMISHMNVIAEHQTVWADNPRSYQISRVICLPMFHAAIGMCANFSVLRDGHMNYILKRFDLEQTLIAHEKYKITETIMVPPIAVAIVKSPLNKKYSLKDMRRVQCGAAPMTRETAMQFQELLAPGVAITQAFGMTEISSIGLQSPIGDDCDMGSSGKLVATLEAKLVDSAGNPITTPNTPGEICFRGPQVTAGYYRNPMANTQAFTFDGFFMSGDIGYCTSPPTADTYSDTSSMTDANAGLWYILDRAREMIKCRAFQVAPPEIEAILLQHPDIVDAAVIGLPGSDENGELIRAYVVRRRDEQGREVEDVDEGVVERWIEERLSRYKWITGGVRFVDGVPKTASGKILKKELKELARREREGVGKSRL